MAGAIDCGVLDDTEKLTFASGRKAKDAKTVVEPPSLIVSAA